MKMWTVSKIRGLKGVERFASVTAYDVTFARLADRAGLPLILVGDSLGQTMLGYSSTLPVTMDDMIRHTAAVCRGVTSALVVGDMPFLSYQISEDEALRNAGRFLQEAGADAVKLEGGALRAPLVARCVANGIPVLGHIGLTPQSVNSLGGYKIQGKTRDAAQRLIDDAGALVEAGAFALVLECMPPDVAAAVTSAVAVPTISVGAGGATDGQMMVMHDLLGLSEGKPARFVKAYAQLGATVDAAFRAYADEVRAGVYPAPEHCYAESDGALYGGR